AGRGRKKMGRRGEGRDGGAPRAGAGGAEQPGGDRRREGEVVPRHLGRVGVRRLQPERGDVAAPRGKLDGERGAGRASVTSEPERLGAELRLRRRDRVRQVVLLEEPVREELSLALAVATQVGQQDVVAAVESAKRFRAPLRRVAPLAVEKEDRRAARSVARWRREDRRELDGVARGAAVAELPDGGARTPERRDELLPFLLRRSQSLGGDQPPGEPSPDEPGREQVEERPARRRQGQGAEGFLHSGLVSLGRG